MPLKEAYALFHFAAHFLEKEDYNILHMNEETNELWLIKLTKNKSIIIRLSQYGYYWANQLKVDIANVFKKIELLKKSFHTKKVVIHNIYITTKEPVDDWQTLKNPIIANTKSPMRMNVFYLSPAESFIEEEKRLMEKLDTSIKKLDTEVPSKEKQDFITMYKALIYSKIEERKVKEQNKILAYGKARVNYYIVSVNILLFFLLQVIGKDVFKPIYNLMVFNKEKIIAGEWWRFVSAIFIHESVWHVVVTVLALYYLGTLIERNFGSIRYSIIFLLAGISGNVINFAYGNNIVINGSTGALFGLLGGLFMFALYYRRLYFQTIGKNILLIFLLLIVLALFFPKLGVLPFIASFIAGFIIAHMMQLPEKGRKYLQFLSALVYIVLVGIILFFA